MKKIAVTLVAVVSALLISASFASAVKPDAPGGGKGSAAKACAAEKKADKAAFREKYGRPAMRNCIKGVTESEGEVTGHEAVAKNAAQACKAERAADPTAFAEKYGTNANGKNAFGKCVSSKVGGGEEEVEVGEEEVEEEDAPADE